MEFNKEQVLDLLESKHVGAGNGANANQIVWELTGGRLANDARKRHLRECIEQLRMAGERVCGHPSNGYFMAETEDELNESCTFLYLRAMASLRKIAMMKRVGIPDLRGQLQLPVQDTEAA